MNSLFSKERSYVEQEDDETKLKYAHTLTEIFWRNPSSSLAPVEKALEIIFLLMKSDEEDPYCLQEIAPLLLLTLDRDEEAYAMIKWYTRLSRVHPGLIKREGYPEPPIEVSEKLFIEYNTTYFLRL